MPLPSSGSISLNQMHIEVGGTSGTTCSLNDSDIRGLIPNRASGALSRFSDFHGRSFGIGQIAAGNSSYSAPSTYVAANWGLYSTDLDGISGIITPYITNHPNFTLNNRSTRFASMNWQPNNIGLALLDKGQVPVSAHNGHPANSGWTTVKLVGNSQTRTLARTAATFNASTRSIGGVIHSQSLWIWSNQTTNPFPSSGNTTSFTVELT